MKSNIVKFAFIVLSLVVGAALEDMLPSVFGLCCPVLLGAAMFFSMETHTPVWVIVAIAAGALEESVSALAPASAIVFFAALATAVRFFREPFAWIVVAYPAYQAWIGLVVDGSGAFTRIAAAIPVGAISILAVLAGLSLAWRKAGADA